MNTIFPEFEFTTTPLAVAVSGGADSMALLLLANAYAAQNKSHVIALTVDHGLREASEKEAIQVQMWANERGIEHVILTWEGPKPTTRIQEKAREARYDLMMNWCKENGVSHLLLGHHAGDQEETFWMRLASGSGLDGLSGMKQQVIKDGITLHRPLLAYSKEDLKAYLKEQNQEWIEDPSNRHNKYLRSRLRSVLEDEGLSSSRLSHVMDKLREDADFIQKAVDSFIEERVQTTSEGYLTLSKEDFLNLHPPVGKRVISSLTGRFNEGAYPPRYEQVSRAFEKMHQNQSFTLGGIYWISKKERYILTREPSRK